jgi:uncharacterized membrane protein
MKVKGLFLLSLAVVAAMLAFAWVVASGLPEGTQLPIYFNGQGIPDNYADAWVALLIAPGVVLAMAFLLAALPSLEPLQDRLEGSAPLLRVTWLATMALMAFMQMSIAAPALGWELPHKLFHVVIGPFLVVLGNMLPKSRPGFFVGIRTPWTISDTDNWIATHRLGGKLMIAAGVIVAFSAFVSTGEAGALLLVVLPIAIATLIPIAYSWWFWRQKKRTA